MRLPNKPSRELKDFGGGWTPDKLHMVRMPRQGKENPVRFLYSHKPISKEDYARLIAGRIRGIVSEATLKAFRCEK